jgi:hypothetical protein
LLQCQAEKELVKIKQYNHRFISLRQMSACGQPSMVIAIYPYIKNPNEFYKYEKIIDKGSWIIGFVNNIASMNYERGKDDKFNPFLSLIHKVWWNIYMKKLRNFWLSLQDTR